MRNSHNITISTEALDRYQLIKAGPLSHFIERVVNSFQPTDVTEVPLKTGRGKKRINITMDDRSWEKAGRDRNTYCEYHNIPVMSVSSWIESLLFHNTEPPSTPNGNVPQLIQSLEKLSQRTDMPPVCSMELQLIIQSFRELSDSTS